MCRMIGRVIRAAVVKAAEGDTRVDPRYEDSNNTGVSMPVKGKGKKKSVSLGCRQRRETK